jgi:epidermal growth factor receptor substrate 15
MYFIQGLMSRSISFVPTTLPPGLLQQASGMPPSTAGSVRSHMTGGSNSGSFTPTSSGFSQTRPNLQPQYTGQTLQPNYTGQSSNASIPPALPARPSALGSSASNFQANGSAAHWDVTAAEKTAADRYFNELDTTHRGFIEGDVAVPFMLKSKLPEEHLARIW